MVVHPPLYTNCSKECQPRCTSHSVFMSLGQVYSTAQRSTTSSRHPQRAYPNFLLPRKTSKMHPDQTIRQRIARANPVNKASEDPLGKLQAQPGRESAASLFEGQLSALSGVPLVGGFTSALRRILGGRLRGRWVVPKEAALEQPSASSARVGLLAAPGDREILSLLLPAMLAVFLDPSMGAIDLAFIGRVGTAPLAAVGLSNLIFFFATVFFSFLIVVITPAVAKAVAKNDRDEASLVIAQSTWIAVFFGSALTAGVWWGAPWLIARFGPAADVAALAVTHLRIRSLACPAQLLLHVANGAFRGFRDTKTPLLAGAAQNIVNLLFDVLLVVWCSWGVVGAATAGTLGLCMGAAAMYGIMLRRGILNPADFARPPGLKEAGKTLAPGIPLGVCISAVMMSVLTATNAASGLGPAALAAHTIMKQIIDYTMFIFGAFSTTAQSLIASSLGKGDRAEGRAYLQRLMRMGISVGVFVAAVVLVFKSQLPYLFTSDPAVGQLVSQLLPIAGLLMPLAPIALALEGTLLGALRITWVGGRTIISALASVAFQLWAQHANWGLQGVWVGMVMLVVGNALLDGLKMTFLDSPLKKED